ncbi:hypothetical protein BAUCODRAFT_38352 [Baudoinia panamericana UAMH 10762]|uniref:Transmembrane protein n=1 Tax=Baudoinia panamericana (strain UAMH 10762) TaxID=717646 RepID=M2M7L3_BAUPA|nr:uncharacterized protein BAUCODRAFT_38352 [Baudoinia panamericana UAMH 10762]EMC92316.1 hypothetical protein BAUCODRAFT_38352 [Baudoinia panamericana UAMH 10762]
MNQQPQQPRQLPPQLPVPPGFMQNPFVGLQGFPQVHGGLMPPQHFFGVPPHAPPQMMGGVPGIPFAQRPGQPPMFAQAVAHHQQQRAAMGMQGLQAPRREQGAPQADGATPQPVDLQANDTNGQPQPPGDGQGQPHTTQAVPGQHFPQPHHRPVSGQGFHFEGVRADGQRVQIHQQTLQFPAQPLNLGIAALPQMPPLFPLAQPLQQAPPQNNGGFTALDRARDNLAEMRRVLDRMQARTGGTEEEQRTEVADLQERLRRVNDYVDPFHVHGLPRAGANTSNTGREAAAPAEAPVQQAQQPQPLPPPPSFTQAPLFRNPLFGNPIQMQQQQPTQRAMSSNEATCYLLSGPQGPQALLFSPQHGTYIGTLANSVSPPTQPRTTLHAATATTPQAGQQGAQGFQQAPRADHAVAAGGQQVLDVAGGQQQVQAAAADPMGPMQPMLNHMWLLLRVLIFAYFLLGSNMGWRRPAALMMIGFGFWMIRAGLFGEGGVIRRWWEGVMQIEQQRPAQQGQQHGQPQGEGATDGQEQAAQQDGGARQAAARGAMPTPEQVAQRLLNEHNQRGNARAQQLREYTRPVERAIALFFASLVPGIGEAQVRAREAEERRRNEEEVAARRREEEERQRPQEEVR